MPADEFDIIRSLFAPLATSAAARGLIDDVAVLETSGRLLVTTDAIVEGVHFLPDDPIDTVAKKALRVNLSDLAAKGARPIGALLTLIWPCHRPAAQIADFARGLGEDLGAYGVALLGGDTTSTPGPLTVSITAFGAPLGARIPSRADARAGQDVWLTGAIGDAFLGLSVLRAGVAEAAAAPLAARYRLPNPRVDFAPIIAAHAGGSMDVSDGLILDARKLAAASGVYVRIVASKVPISAAARAWIERTGVDEASLFSGGDDYEILFTADPSVREVLAGAGASCIGYARAGGGVELIGADGQAMQIARPGHAHALGR
jgi:thiamine-monophosphate kinase